MHHISFDYQLSEKRTFNRNRAGDAVKPPENCTECLWFAIILSCLNTCYLLKLCMICCSRVALRSCQNANNCKSPHCDSFKRASLLNALRSKSNLMNLLIAVLLLLCGSSLPDGRYWNMFTSRFFNKHKLSSRFKYWRFVDLPQRGNSMLRWILFGFSMLFRSARGSYFDISILAFVSLLPLLIGSNFQSATMNYSLPRCNFSVFISAVSVFWSMLHADFSTV